MLPQPAVSRYISTLENELGAPLFDRVNNRKVVLTEAGKRYFNFFQRFSLEFLRIQNMLSGGASVLRLGYNTGWNLAGFLPEVIRECRQLVPDFQVYLECLDFGNLITGLKEQQLDAVLSMENYLNQEADLEVSRITGLSRYIVYSDQLKDAEQVASPADFHACDFFIVDDLRVWQICQNEVDLSVMNQYTPNERCRKQGGSLSRPLDDDEYETVLDYADALGFERMWWQQGGTVSESFVPAFDATGVKGPELGQSGNNR